MVETGRIRRVIALYDREMFTTIRWRERVTHNQPKRRRGKREIGIREGKREGTDEFSKSRKRFLSATDVREY
jgi:hypothetical protein